MSQEVARFADVGMYLAEPDPTAAKDVPIEPRVTLLSQTANPLRVMAAAAEMYRGRIVRDITEITEQEALFWLGEMTQTKIQAGLEFIDFHFLFEGVSRGFTHQLVRQRTAVFVQESQRFAVKENAALEISMPPSITSRKPDDPMRIIWENANSYDAWVYNALIAGGIPAEDARGRLPTNITTRVHYKTNLRNLAEHSGLRLCSQAQHEWKAVWSRIVTAILSYGPEEERWQQRAIASLFRPVCYQTGRCEFRGKNDRWCVIRERVEEHHRKGEGPEQWADINPMEPLMDGAARAKPGSAQNQS